MIARALSFCARRPVPVLIAALVAAFAGELARRALARDAVPDLSDPRIAVVADWMGHDATDVANEVTRGLTTALEGVPGAIAVRGSSMSGMAYVEVVLTAPSLLPAARAEIARRVDAARPRLPAGVRVDVGPEASSTGWVFQYALIVPTLRDPMHFAAAPRAPQSPFGLRRFQDERLRPALAAVPGVAEVASVGGAVDEVLVEARAAALRDRGVAFSDVAAAARGALAAGAPIEKAVDRASVRVRVAPGMVSGVVDYGGFIPAVGGIVIARSDADATAVIARVKEVLERERSGLPEGVALVVVYDRSELAGRVERTALRALAQEVAAVALVVLVLLLHARSALLPLLTLPLVVLLTFAAMRLLRVPIDVMSLSGIGIALGMAVDADVVALEACHRRLQGGQERTGPPPAHLDRRAALIAAGGSFAPAILTSLVIAALSFLPVLAFSGETGRLLRPLAVTKTLVFAAAALVAITVAPALRDRLLGGSARIVPELANPIVRRMVSLYRPFVLFALRRPAFTLVTALFAVVSAVPVAARLGVEFLPRFDEGDLLYMPTTTAGLAPETAAMQLGRQDQGLQTAREIRSVFGKAGRAETATDPAPFSMIETTIRLKQRDDWPRRTRQRWYSTWAPAPLKGLLGLAWPEETPATWAELTESLDRRGRLAGWQSGWTAPIRARMDMLSTGVRTPVGIRVVAPDSERLDAIAATVRAGALRLPGTRSAFQESLGVETRLGFVPDSEALARYHVDPAQARATADLVLGGGSIGDVAHDGRRARVRVLPDLLPAGASELRRPDELLRETTVRASAAGGGQPVPLGLLGRAAVLAGPATIRSERGELVGYVHVDLDDGIDLGHYVEAGQPEVARAVGALRPGERIEWTGQYALWAAGRARLFVIVPIVILSMLALLYLQFRNLTEALVVLASVPFALVGSFWTLSLLGYQMSAPVWVGLLSTVGLAMQMGVVMVVYVDAAFYRRLREGHLETREDIVAAHAEGTILRLRPKMMTLATMAAGLAPIMWAEGAGAEIMKRVAAPMLGGLVSSAFLTLEVLPVLYTIWRHGQLRRARRRGVPLAQVVGAPPAWAR